MAGRYRSRHLVLRDFERVLSRHDPMGLCSHDNPGKDNEYDQEALSILARFHESALQGFHDDPDVVQIASVLVQEAFVFWFNRPIIDEDGCRRLTEDLLHAFYASFPRPSKQPTEPGVGSPA